MKKISLWGIFLLFLFLFCGCASEKPAELWVVTEKGTWDRMNGQLYVLEQTWEESHPGMDIRVEYLPTDQQERAVYLQQLRTEILQGGGPDCYLLPTDNSLILDEPQQYTYVDVEPLFSDVTLAMQNGLFYDLSEFYDVDDDLGKDGLNTQIMDAGVVDGKRYVLPLRYDMPVIYAFNDALEEAGVDIAVLNKSIDSIMEAVGSTGDPILASGIFRDSLDVLSRVVDYESGNAAVDGILYHYSQRAEVAGIKLKIAGTVKSNGIPDDELSVLLGNAMENAFAGCQTVEEGRFVTVVAQSEPQVLSLMIQNSFDGNLKIKHGELHSRKRTHGPGIGISSMKMICEKYGGTMEMQWDDHSFTVLIVLPVQS